MSLENWTSHFQEVDSLLRYAERQYGIANASLSDHMIERFELSIQSCTSIMNEFVNPSVSLTEEEKSALDDCKGSLGDLLSNLRFLLDKWKEYRGVCNSTHCGVSYQAPIVHNGRRGRPRFEIDREQLDYLVSLSFKWNEIAALVGVSRMTLYRLGIMPGVCTVASYLFIFAEGGTILA